MSPWNRNATQSSSQELGKGHTEGRAGRTCYQCCERGSVGRARTAGQRWRGWRCSGSTCEAKPGKGTLARPPTFREPGNWGTAARPWKYKCQWQVHVTLQLVHKLLQGHLHLKAQILNYKTWINDKQNFNVQGHHTEDHEYNPDITLKSPGWRTPPSPPVLYTPVDKILLNIQGFVLSISKLLSFL